MRRTQHLAALFVALSLLPVSARAQTQAPTVGEIVALVAGSPQLRIDDTLFSSTSDAKTHPYVNIRNGPEGTIGGYLVPEGARAGTLSDGTYVLAVPLDSGGSGGIFTQIVFAQSDECAGVRRLHRVRRSLSGWGRRRRHRGDAALLRR